MTAESGHLPNREYVSQSGDFHLNGAKFFDSFEIDISAAIHNLGSGVLPTLTADLNFGGHNLTNAGSASFAAGNFTVDASAGNVSQHGTLSTGNGNFTVDSGGNVLAVGTLSTSGGHFTVDTSGNVVVAGGLSFSAASTGFIISNGQLAITTLATSDPHTSGVLWNNSGTVTISAG